MSEPGLRLVPADGPADVEALMGRVARGDAQAFAALYDELSPAVFGLARRVVRDPARAEDVTQEVFLEVWRKAARYDSNLGRPKTWIMTITHRRAVDAVRRGESQKRQDDHGAPDEVIHDEPADAVIRAEEHGAVRGCLETLTDLQLESVRLAYFNGYTYTAVATLSTSRCPRSRRE
jgi:RNA polymerase sigma-70 factor (ECF subfamily)